MTSLSARVCSVCLTSWLFCKLSTRLDTTPREQLLRAVRAPRLLLTGLTLRRRANPRLALLHEPLQHLQHPGGALLTGACCPDPCDWPWPLSVTTDAGRLTSHR